MNIENTCRNCGKKFHVAPSEINRRTVCSLDCKREWHRNNPVRANSTLLKCPQCHVEFWKQNSQMVGKKNIYCSRQCMWKAKETIPVKECAWCGREFKPKGKSTTIASPCCSLKCLKSKQVKDNDDKLAHILSNVDKATLTEIAMLCGKSQTGGIMDRIRRLGLEEKVLPNISYFERLVCSMLDSMGVSYVTHDRTILGGQEIDILIPDYRIGIEVNDIESHNSSGVGERRKDYKYHYNKWDGCRKKGVQLITIWEWDLKNNSNLLRSMLSAKLKSSGCVKVQARQCTVASIPQAVYSSFLEENHIQGTQNAAYRLGLLFNSEIISVMGFGKSKDGWELLRFCSKAGHRVTAGTSKLLSHFRKEHVGPIYSFSFNDYSDGGVYKKLGFTKVSDVEPRYWWVKPGRHIEVLGRRACQKKNIAKTFGVDIDGKTEAQLMRERHYVQVFDSGKQLWYLP